MCCRSNRRASSSCWGTTCCCNACGLGSCGCRTSRNTNRLFPKCSRAACDNRSWNKTLTASLKSCSASGTLGTASSRRAPRRLPAATGSHSEAERGNAGTPERCYARRAASPATGSDLARQLLQQSNRRRRLLQQSHQFHRRRRARLLRARLRANRSRRRRQRLRRRRFMRFKRRRAQHHLTLACFLIRVRYVIQIHDRDLSTKSHEKHIELVAENIRLAI